MMFRPVEKNDERPRINDGGAHFDRSPRNTWDSKEGPELRNPPLRAQPSSARLGSDAAFCAELRARATIPPRLEDPTLLDRVGMYEARLWRQAAQTIWTLDAMR